MSAGRYSRRGRNPEFAEHAFEMKGKRLEFAKYHVGVFDSGLGGRFVAERLAEMLPGLRLTVLSDNENIPYGRKTPEEMLACITPFMTRFNDLKVDAVVMACNTCFTNLEPELRSLLTCPLLGFEPALTEAAADSRSRSVVICATQGTLRSRRWQAMKSAQPKDLKIVDIDCSDWVSLIESGGIEDAHLRPIIETAAASRADGLVLGCTHYHWLKQELLALLPAGYVLKLYEPTARVVAELRRLLEADS